MNWYNKLNGLEGTDQVNSKVAWKWYDELNEELKTKSGDLDKLNFLKFHYKEFIKTLFYKLEISRAKQYPNMSYPASDMEKELLSEIEYLEFKIKNNVAEPVVNKSHAKPSFKVKPLVLATLEKMFNEEKINKDTPAKDLCTKLRPLVKNQVADSTIDRYVKGWREEKKKSKWKKVKK